MDSREKKMIMRGVAFRIHNRSSEVISCPICRSGFGVRCQESMFQPGYHPSDAEIFDQTIAIPLNAKVMDIWIGTANGAWEDYLSLVGPNLGRGWTSQRGDWYGTYNAVTAATGVAISCSYTKNTNWQSRMVYVNAGGQVIPIQENFIYTPRADQASATLLVSSNEYAQIKEFRLQRRPYQWAGFRNVSLIPYQKTAVTIASKQAISHSDMLEEPPLLRFLEWDNQWQTNHPFGTHYPDGRIVTNHQELALLRSMPIALMSDVSGLPDLAKRKPHFLHLWFSHPLFDESCFSEVTFFNPNDENLTDLFAPRTTEIKSAGNQYRESAWLIASQMCGEAANVPARLAIRLRYTVGPLEQVQRVAPDNSNGLLMLPGESQLDSIGQNARGNAFLTISVNSKTMKTLRYGVTAITKDGREFTSSGGITGQLDGTGPQVAHFDFEVPLAEVAQFLIGTRTIHTFEWQDVILPGKID
jgi:hypothetical protein